jgi:predicted flap endonuclease-1-like 5' DNA nuclease
MIVAGLLKAPFAVIHSERGIAMSKKESTFNSKTGQPAVTDDLKLINGIGPAVEKRLHGVGVFTFAQLALLSSADIAAAVVELNGLSAERITRRRSSRAPQDSRSQRTLRCPAHSRP